MFPASPNTGQRYRELPAIRSAVRIAVCNIYTLYQKGGLGLCVLSTTAEETLAPVSLDEQQQQQLKH
jgi:hypothetical protein